ncbi:MAG: Mth938-like domain-containing protein [Gammaproteobacteria bacterium]
MAFTRENNVGNAIHSYTIGEIQIIQNTVSDGVIEAKLNPVTSNLIISPSALIMNWIVGDLDEISDNSIQQIVELQPEIVILGVGAKMKLPSVKINLLFQNYNIGLEIMDTAAACRTYNFLLTEGRNVAAALFQISPE